MNWSEIIEINKKNHSDKYPSIIHDKRVAVVAGGVFKGDYASQEVLVTINGHNIVTRLTGQKLVGYWNNTELNEHRKNFLKDYSFLHINIPSQDGLEVASYCEEIGLPWAFFGCDDEMEIYGYLPTVRWPKPLMDHYGMSPLTGTSAIYHLLQHPIKELFVTGMDLYSSCNDRNLIPQFIAIHEILPQIRFLKDILEKDGRVRFDIILEGIVKRYPEWASRVDELPIIPNPATRECIWPGMKVEPWSIPKIIRIMYEIKQGNEQFFKEIVDVVNSMDKGESLERFAKGLIPTVNINDSRDVALSEQSEPKGGKESSSIHTTAGAAVSCN